MYVTDKKAVLERLHAQWRELRANHLPLEDARIVGISLQGSQNYNTDHEGSDVDSKAELIPTLKSLILGTDVSKEVSLANNEKVSMKTSMEFVNLFFRGNVNNLEMLYTEYKIDDHLSFIQQQVVPLRTEIVNSVKKTILHAACGMIIQKQKSLYKGTETTRAFVEEFGYDPKDASHILRLHDLVTDLCDGIEFGKALRVRPSTKILMTQIKTGIHVDDINEMTHEWSLAARRIASESEIENDSREIIVLREHFRSEYVKWYKNFSEQNLV